MRALVFTLILSLVAGPALAYNCEPANLEKAKQRFAQGALYYKLDKYGIT